MTPRFAVWLFVWSALQIVTAAALAAQGVTDAAVEGTVLQADSTPVVDATVSVTNSATGERWATVTRTNGRFLLDHLSVGGPYRVDVRAIGFSPASRNEIFLALSQRLTLDVDLVPVTLQLEELTVRGEVDSRINASRTGPAQTISDTLITRLPNLGRDLFAPIMLSPQVSLTPNGFSVAGANDRLNDVQLDGITTSDLKGNSREGGLVPLPIEAIEEVQLNVAPFDVRIGNFAGGQVNAVSKSGTNQWQGSVFGYYDSPSLAGTNPDGTRTDPYSRKEAGLTLGGPLFRDRLAAFVSISGLQQPSFIYLNPGTDTTGGADSVGTGIRHATMVRFQEILGGYGVQPGTFETDRFRFTKRTIFGKLTAQLGLNSRLEISHDYVYQNGHVPYTCCFNAGLSSNAEEDPVRNHITNINWTTAFNAAWSNELIVGRNASRHRCIPNANFPTIMVEADAGSIVAGTQEVCRGQVNGQSILEMTDNVGFTTGTHHFTFGTHNERVRVYDDETGLLNSVGRWHFASLDSLQQGLPDAYFRDVPGPLMPEGGFPDFHAVQLGLYVQDQWSPTPRLTVTGGLRMDVPFLPTNPRQNVELLDALGINTERTPSGHVLWSPRLGVNYDLTGKETTYLRGGVGLFEGRPLYGWLEEAYIGTGLQRLFLECFEDEVPAFTMGPDQPTQCGSGDFATPFITAFDPEFQYPQNLRASIGADHRLPWGVVGTMDLVYTRGVHQFAVHDANLLPSSTVAIGEGGRPLYGTVDPDGVGQPNRRSEAFDQVALITNGSGDRAYSLAFQLQKRFSNGNELLAAYTYTHATNRQDTPAVGSFDNLWTTALDGTWESRNRRTSLYSHPHTVRLAGTFNLPFDIRLGLLYFGESGDPFTYMVSGDANGDGFGNLGFDNNDPIYVPRDPGDIDLVNPEDPSMPAAAEHYAGLEEFIQSDACLRTQRGRVVRRNSCRDAFWGELDAKLSKIAPIARGHTMELSADIFNVPNFLDRNWGRKYAMEGFELLRLVGYDEVKGRGIYIFTPPRRHEFQVEPTRWLVRLNAKYNF